MAGSKPIMTDTKRMAGRKIPNQEWGGKAKANRMNTIKKSLIYYGTGVQIYRSTPVRIRRHFKFCLEVVKGTF